MRLDKLSLQAVDTRRARRQQRKASQQCFVTPALHAAHPVRFSPHRRLFLPSRVRFISSSLSASGETEQLRERERTREAISPRLPTSAQSPTQAGALRPSPPRLSYQSQMVLEAGRKLEGGEEHVESRGEGVSRKRRPGILREAYSMQPRERPRTWRSPSGAERPREER